MPKPSACIFLQAVGQIIGEQVKAAIVRFSLRVLLEFHILLAGFNPLGQFIVTLFEQYVDIRPGLRDVVLNLDQIVLDHDQRDGDDDCGDTQYGGDDRH